MIVKKCKVSIDKNSNHIYNRAYLEIKNVQGYWLWQFQMFTNSSPLPLGWDTQWCIKPLCFTETKVSVKHLQQGLSTSAPIHLLSGKTFGICQSNIVFVQFY